MPTLEEVRYILDLVYKGYAVNPDLRMKAKWVVDNIDKLKRLK